MTNVRLKDSQGLDISTSNPEIVEVYNQFVEQVLGYGKAADVLFKIVQEEKCALVQALCAILLLHQENYHGCSKEDTRQKAFRYLQLAQKNATEATDRERLYVRVAEASWSSDKDQVINLFEEIVERWPRDILATKMTQEQYFNLGDSENLLRIAEKAFPHNQDNYHIYAMKGFGLAECFRFEEAERLGRMGTELAPNKKEPWAHHAVAHCMELQGRLDEGIQWMESHSSLWEDCNSFMYTHNWWHLGLFHLDRDASEDFLLKLYDERVWGVCKESAQDQLNAVSLLWRLKLRNIHGVAARWDDVTSYILPHIKEHVQPFIDLHYIYALAASGSKERVEEMLSSLSEAKYSRNQQEVTFPLAKATVAHAQGDYETAYTYLKPYIHRLREAGGSVAQRDVYDQTYIDTLIQTGRLEEALPFVQARSRCRPRTPAIQRDLKKIYAAIGDKQKAQIVQDLISDLEKLYNTGPQ